MLSPQAWPVRLARLLLASLGLAAVGSQFAHEVVMPGFSAVNFFSYFTILSNTVTGLALLVLAVRPLPSRPVLAEATRGALTVYMATTGLVFLVLLDDGDPGLTLPWVNTVIHRVVPIAVLVDWLLVRQRGAVRYSWAVAWLAVPVAYVGYSVVRGLVVGWYPYPFLQPGLVGGIGGVLVRLAFIAAGIVLASLVMAWLGNRSVARPRVRASTSPL